MAPASVLSRPQPERGEKTRTPGEPPDHALGRSRGGIGSKLHVVWDSLGTITAFRLTAGNVNECTAFVALMESVSVPSGHGRPRKRPRRLAGDKGYSTRAIRAWCSKHNVRAVIPERRDQIEQRKRRPGRKPAFDREQYRRRNIVERAVGWLKNQRRIATRSEKRAVHYESMITIALVARYATKLPDTT